MKKTDEGYITPEQAKKIGIIKNANGLYYKQNTIEKYASKGWLDFGSPKNTSLDRLSAANRIASDFYKSRISGFGTVDLEKVRVDCCRRVDVSPAAWDARVRLFKALKDIGCYANIIFNTCCLDAERSVEKTSRYRHDLEIYKENLCRGLDRLIKYYYGDQKPAKPQMRGISSFNVFDNLDDYIEKLANN
jgi:hypothetical protein